MNADLKIAKEQTDKRLHDFLIARNSLLQKEVTYHPKLGVDEYGDLVLESSEVRKVSINI